jgi:SAM-dependent methyltransferase
MVKARPLLKRAAATLMDGADRIRGSTDPTLPSRRMMVTIGSRPSKTDFIRQGERQTRVMRTLGGLRPEHDVLDVGCGCGRAALQLTDFLTGRYEGFDIDPNAVRWCEENITPRHPRFHFQLADLRNTFYNPTGGSAASEFRFPYDDASFDFAFHISVFTHLLPDAAENYVRETARVLRTGGTAFATFLLITDRRAEAADRGDLPLRFRDRRPEYWAVHEEDPEGVIAYREPDVTSLFRLAGLEPEVHRGRWAGDGDYELWQDLIVGRRGPGEGPHNDSAHGDGR